jgi:hypothetical protein
MEKIMKNKKMDIEKKIYELLGVKYFKKLVMLIPYSLTRLQNKNEDKSIIYQKVMKRSDNYNIGSVTDIEKIIGFKKYLKSNSYIHVIAEIMLIINLIGNYLTKTNVSIPNFVFLTILNSYCIMLQRYNYLRLKPIIEIYKEKKEKIKEEIKEEDSKIKDHYYTYRYEYNESKGKDKNITLDEMINTFSLKELKSLKSYINLVQDNYELYLLVQENNEYPLELEHHKKLNLKLKNK